MCCKCGKPIDNIAIYRNSVCDFCKSDLHSCVNCRFYEQGRHYDCNEQIEEPISDKERANFCDSFSVKRIFNSSTSSAQHKKQTAQSSAARDLFNSLFAR